jgi:hypothetical protein
LEDLYSSAIKDHKQFKVDKNGNYWTFQLVRCSNGKMTLRAKVYCKTADKLTSVGVGHNSISEPLDGLFLTYDSKEKSTN